MRRVLLLLAALAVLPFLFSPPAAAQPSMVRVTEAFVLPAPRGHATAAYMNIQGGPDKLVGAGSGVAERVELHETVMQNGVTTMRPVGGVLIDPGAATRLAPGGPHVMLIGLKHALKVGDTVTLTLAFERAGKVTVMAPVARAGAPADAARH